MVLDLQGMPLCSDIPAEATPNISRLSIVDESFQIEPYKEDSPSLSVTGILGLNDGDGYGQVLASVVRGTLTLAATGMQGLYGGDGDDLIQASVVNSGQVHLFGRIGDDTFILDLENETGHQGHHAYGGEGSDTFNFVNIHLVQAPVVGRINDFEPTRDLIQIEGQTINLNALPATIQIADGSFVTLRIVEYTSIGATNSASALGLGPQQFLQIGENVFYALDGAREGGAELHFISVPEPSALTEVRYHNEVNFVPYSYYENLDLRIRLVSHDDDGFNGFNTSEYIRGDIRGNVTGSHTDEVIFANGGNDIVDGSSGDDHIYGGIGDDTIAGGIDNDTLEGEDGNDRLYGGSGNDELFGGNDNDTMNGGSGSDFFDGGSGVDLVIYERVSDRVIVDLQNTAINTGDAAGDTFVNVEAIQTSAGADNLRGDSSANIFLSGNSSDRLYGRAGNDTLNGEGGADALYGNLGADVMTGGDGDVRDRFIYFNIADSGVGAGNRDIITDYQAGIDRIEISRFDADTTQGGKQGFDFIGNADFSNTAGELRFEQIGSSTLIQADVNGDSIADFEIELSGSLTLTTADFMI